MAVSVAVPMKNSDVVLWLLQRVTAMMFSLPVCLFVFLSLLCGPRFWLLLLVFSSYSESEFTCICLHSATAPS